jgi:hypothetical protein
MSIGEHQMSRRIIQTILGRSSSKSPGFKSIKAGLLSILMVFATTPIANAQQQTATPYESNCVVTVGQPGCGFGGVYPCTITYVLTASDSTPGAMITYQVDCSWTGYLIGGETLSGGTITIVEGYGQQSTCYGGYLSGTMWATADGYSQSDTASLNF